MTIRTSFTFKDRNHLSILYKLHFLQTQYPNKQTYLYVRQKNTHKNAYKDFLQAFHVKSQTIEYDHINIEASVKYLDSKNLLLHEDDEIFLDVKKALLVIENKKQVINNKIVDYSKYDRIKIKNSTDYEKKFMQIVSDIKLNIEEVIMYKQKFKNNIPYLIMYEIFDKKIPQYTLIDFVNIKNKNGRLLKIGKDKNIFIENYIDEGYSPYSLMKTIKNMDFNNIFDHTELYKHNKEYYMNAEYMYNRYMFKAFALHNKIYISDSINEDMLKELFSKSCNYYELFQNAKPFYFSYKTIMADNSEALNFIQENKDNVILIVDKFVLVKEWDRLSIKQFLIHLHETLPIKHKKIDLLLQYMLTGSKSPFSVGEVMWMLGEKEVAFRLYESSNL